MTNFGPCRFCGDPVVSPPQVACFPVFGWEALRDGGGANKIMWRQRDETTVAHESCVNDNARKERQGISPDQETLV